MPLRFFDAHTHVNLAAFKGDYKEAIGRALDAGVGMVNVGTQKDTSLRAVEITREFSSGVYATVGLHPVHTDKSFHDANELGLPAEALAKEGGGEAVKTFTSRGEIFDYEYYKKLAADPKVVAIGECGLDYFRIEIDKTDINDIKNKQKAAFAEQIKLAHEIKKPLMIHCRNAPSTGSGQAFPDLIELLTTNHELLNLTPGIIHFFTGTQKEAKKLLDLGFSFTFGGVVTFTRDYDEVIKIIPPDRILCETDAPYVAPAPYRGLPAGRQGKRNEPLYVIEVVKKLAELRGISEEEMAAQTIVNAERIFKISLS